MSSFQAISLHFKTVAFGSIADPDPIIPTTCSDMRHPSNFPSEKSVPKKTKVKRDISKCCGRRDHEAAAS
jgi:hypothetical protein